MAPAFEGLFVMRRNVLLTSLLILLSSVSAMAWKVTIDSTDATGGGNYYSFDEFLDSLTNNKRPLSSSGEDTVLFVGTEQRTHIISKYVASTTAGRLRFIGQITKPDEFMILNHTAGSWYNLLDNVDVAFERLIFTGTAEFTTGNKAKTQHFRNCVIRQFTSNAASFLSIGSTGASHTIFENCLFHNNQFTRGLVDIQAYGTTAPTVKWINCTIHYNDNVFSCKSDVTQDSLLVKNCIFSANTSIFYDATEFKDKIIYSVVPNDTYDGTGNIVASDPSYTVPSGKVNPSDWRPVDSSVAQGLGDTTGVPKTDISGKARADEPGKRDAGCWDILDAVKITVQPLPDTAGVGDTVAFNIRVTGAPEITYAWFRKSTSIEQLSSTSDTLKLENVQLTDDSTFYFCVATNAINSMASDTVVLRVFQTPVVTDDPDPTIIYAGDTAKFSVAATGGALSYSWICNDTVIPGATSATVALAVADSGNEYSCKISNPLGYATSAKALLQVFPPEVRIISYTANQELMEGDNLTLTVEANGKPPLNYSWIKVGRATAVSVSESYQKSDITLGDSGVYRCIVENASSKDSVDIKVSVAVGVAPKITSSSGPFVAVKVGDPVTLSVTATGAEPLVYTWYSHNGPAFDSVASGSDYLIDPSEKADSGDYICVVSNDLGEDTAQVTLNVSSSPYFNPLALECSFIDPTHVQVKISNFRELPAASGSDPYAETIGLWYDPFTFPTGEFGSSDSNCIKIPLSAMLAVSGDTYDTSVSVPGTGDECGDMYFTLTPFWKNPDTIISSVASIQNAKVYMCGTAVLENNMSLDVAYTPVTDSIVVTVSNLTSLNRDSLMSLNITYLFPGHQAVKTTFTPDELPSVSEDEFVKVLKDEAFTASEETLTVNLTWRGVLGNTSVPVIKKLVVGKPRPINTAELFIDSTTTATAGIHWQFSGSTDEFDSIRVVWTAQPLTPSTIITGSSFRTQMLGNSVRSLVIDRLVSELEYNIGVQVVKNSVFSLLTPASIATCTTKVDTSGKVENSIDIISASFISSENRIKLVWTIDPELSGAVDRLATGIVWETDTTPDVLNMLSGNEVVIVTDCKDTTTYFVDLKEDIRFSTEYHFALVLSKKGTAAWSWTSPIESSRKIVTTGEPEWQKVSYFPDDKQVVTAFNGTVVLEKVDESVVSVEDTVLVFSPESLATGFIRAGNLGFNFKRDVKSDPIRIGLKYDTSILKGHSASEIRLYQFDADEENWHIVEGTIVDTGAEKVSVVLRPDKFPNPFMLLIDTLPPEVEITSDTAGAVEPGTEIVDTITVTDNIANSSVSLLYWGCNGSGGKTAKTETCTSSVTTMAITVPSDSIVGDRSFKAELVVTDGVSRRVFDVSRRVKRETSDPVGLSGMKWTPVMTTSELDSDSIEDALSELSSGDKWNYNSMNFRLFRWIDTGSAPRDWIEYKPAASSFFTLKPGNVIWVKTRKNKDISSLGPGVTVSVKEPFPIELKARDWTDIALPYKMDIHLGDILTSSDSTLELKNKLLVYGWEVKGEDGKIGAEPKYIANFEGYDLETTVLSSRAEGDDGVASYSVFNSDSVTHTLRIPPVPESFSSFETLSKNLSKRKKSADGWSVIVRAQSDGETVTPVIFGSRKGAGNRSFPPPPGFLSQRMYLENMDGKKKLGAVLNNTPDEGVALNLIFENSGKGVARFKCDLSDVHNLPENWKTVLYHPEKRVLLDDDSEPVTVTAGSRRYTVVLAGDSAFVASRIAAFMPQLSLLRLYPNPCRGLLTLRFGLPPADVKMVKVTIYDQLGRSVRTRTYEGARLRTGYNVINWKLRGTSQGLSAGTYIVRLSAYTSDGKVLGKKQIKMLYVP